MTLLLKEEANAPMETPTTLPPGQYQSTEFPRFGLPRYASRFPGRAEELRVEVVGEVEQSLVLAEELRDLPRVDQVSDFHCVTTWSHRSLPWSGFRFVDFYERLVVPRARPHRDRCAITAGERNPSTTPAETVIVPSARVWSRHAG